MPAGNRLRTKKLSTPSPPDAPPAPARSKPRVALAASRPEVSVVMPCLDEAETIADCVSEAWAVLEQSGRSGEVVVVDNGSSDGSAALAAEAGARVVSEPERGYGNAYLAGFAAARGRYIVMADADLTYDLRQLPRFVDELERGADLVMGDRMDAIEPGAMPWLHRYVGNPLMSRALNLLFRTGVRDVWCGMRALRADQLRRLGLRTTGMELALEMVTRASRLGLEIRQLPVALAPRRGQSKLARFRDGWRGLRFMLVHSPAHVFALPGAALVLLGTALAVVVLTQVELLGRTWELHALIAGAALVLMGTQILGLGACAHAYRAYFLGESEPWFERARRRLRLEHGLLAGGALVAAGVTLGGVIAGRWVENGLGTLSEERLTVIAALLVSLGCQVFFTSFLLSMLALRRGAAAPSARRDVAGPQPFPDVARNGKLEETRPGVVAARRGT